MREIPALSWPSTHQHTAVSQCSIDKYGHRITSLTGSTLATAPALQDQVRDGWLNYLRYSVAQGMVISKAKGLHGHCGFYHYWWRFGRLCTANRLSANPRNSVLLLEAGGEDRNPLIHVPAGYIKTMVNPAINWMFETEPGEGTGGRRIAFPRGKVMGGSSAINAMLYVRGQRQDYDDWAQRGNRGWSYEDVLPYFRKAEHCEASVPKTWIPPACQDGPLNVAMVRSRYQALDMVINAAEANGYPTIQIITAMIRKVSPIIR